MELYSVWFLHMEPGAVIFASNCPALIPSVTEVQPVVSRRRFEILECYLEF